MAFWRPDTGRNNRLAATRPLRVLQPSTHRWVNRIQSGTAQNVADYENGSSRWRMAGRRPAEPQQESSSASIGLMTIAREAHPAVSIPSGQQELLGCVGTQLLSSRRFRVGRSSSFPLSSLPLLSAEDVRRKLGLFGSSFFS